MPEFAFQAATDEDATRLAELRVRAMRESLQAAGRFDEERARARLLADYAAERTTLIVSRQCLAGFFVLREAGDELLLQHLYVDPPFQSQGLGSLVLQRIFDEADRQRRTLRVGALKGSASNRFYARRGFVEAMRTEFDVHYVRLPR